MKKRNSTAFCDVKNLIGYEEIDASNKGNMGFICIEFSPVSNPQWIFIRHKLLFYHRRDGDSIKVDPF